jgi:hypothetical protein
VERTVKTFLMGFIAGLVSAVLVFALIAGLRYLNKRDKELIEYAERQMEIEEMREDIINRPVDDFLEIPGVRQSADGAAAEFDRKRDEAVQRFRSRYTDR